MSKIVVSAIRFNLLSGIIIFCITSVCFGFIFFDGDRMVANKKEILKAAFPNTSALLTYDPANIQLSFEYVFLEAVYSSLIEYNSEGKLSPGVAEKFWWDNNSLHLQIRKNLRTIDNHLITPDDVVFSLKRVMLLGGNTHGNLVSLLCGNQTISSVDDHCSGIKIDGHTVILSPGHPNSFLAPMLTGIDFAVIPRSSVDPKTLKIIDMRNTSGPLYVDMTGSRVILKANPNHFNFHSTTVENIELVPTIHHPSGPTDGLSLFDRGEVDLVTTIDLSSAEKVVEYYQQHQAKTELHSSLDIRIFMVRYSPLGLKTFSEAERKVIGARLVKSLRENISSKSSILKPTDQIVPAYGEGSLDDSMIQQVLTDRESAHADIDWNRKVKFYLVRLPNIAQFKNAILAVFPNAVFYDSNERALPNWGNDNTEIKIAGPDMGFVEDISLYSYAVKAGIFRTDIPADAWLAEYMKIQNKEERIAMIKKLHFSNLKQAMVLPIFASPYVALARKPWKMTLPNLFANHPLWQTHWQP